MIVVGRSPPVIVVNGVRYKLMCHCPSLQNNLVKVRRLYGNLVRSGLCSGYSTFAS